MFDIRDMDWDIWDSVLLSEIQCRSIELSCVCVMSLSSCAMIVVVVLIQEWSDGDGDDT